VPLQRPKLTDRCPLHSTIPTDRSEHLHPRVHRAPSRRVPAARRPRCRGGARSSRHGRSGESRVGRSRAVTPGPLQPVIASQGQVAARRARLEVERRHAATVVEPPLPPDPAREPSHRTEMPCSLARRDPRDRLLTRTGQVHCSTPEFRWLGCRHPRTPPEAITASDQVSGKSAQAPAGLGWRTAILAA
jgi:hypothetical protein